MRKWGKTGFCCLLLLTFTPFALAQSPCASDVGTGPADGAIHFDEDSVTTPGPLGTRTPLIMIHGIHGNASDWFELRQFLFSSTSFKSSYKIYLYSYPSDQFPVCEVARSLRNQIDAMINAGAAGFNGPIVIIAHSMGGLVARSYMNEFHLRSPGANGQRGGDTVRALITLGTPHHGTP